jgi:hypothetical protein
MFAKHSFLTRIRCVSDVYVRCIVRVAEVDYQAVGMRLLPACVWWDGHGVGLRSLRQSQHMVYDVNIARVKVPPKDTLVWSQLKKQD